MLLFIVWMTNLYNFTRRISSTDKCVGREDVAGWPAPSCGSTQRTVSWTIHGYMLRHKVKPGITGLAQVNGWRGETDTLDKMEKRIECDLEYIRNWSLWLDLKIIWFTVAKVFFGKNAY